MKIEINETGVWVFFWIMAFSAISWIAYLVAKVHGAV